MKNKSTFRSLHPWISSLRITTITIFFFAIYPPLVDNVLAAIHYPSSQSRERSVYEFGAKCNGIEDDSAAFLAASRTGIIFVPKMGIGLCRISTNLTIENGILLDISLGATLNIDSDVILTIKGVINQNIRYPIFSGKGIVVGLRRSLPEWWLDGDDSSRLQSAIASSEESDKSDGDEQVIIVSCRIYSLTRPIQLAPTNRRLLKLQGCGAQTGGSVIQPADNFQGESLLIIVGDNNSGADFDVRGFQFISQDLDNLKYCITFGIADGRLQGSGYSKVSDISCVDFRSGMNFSNSRLIQVSRVSIFSSLVFSTCINLIPEGPNAFVGDLDFDHINCSPNQRPDFEALLGKNGTKYINIGTPLGGSVSGVRIEGAFYHSDLGVQIRSEKGGSINDIWFLPGTQFDGPQCNVFEVSVVSDQSSDAKITYMEDLNLNQVYIRGVKAGCQVFSFRNLTDSSYDRSVLRGFSINNNWIANADSGIIFADGLSNSTFNDNRITDSGYKGTIGIQIHSGSEITVSNNSCRQSGKDPLFMWDRFFDFSPHQESMVMSGNSLSPSCR